MSAYYNETDPFATAWLRELIKAGHVAPGEVDERSIEDVVPTDLAGFTQCHFFAGIGVWSYVLRRRSAQPRSLRGAVAVRGVSIPETTIKRPALRYHGGKWRLAPWIRKHFPPHKIYVEPYCGAASVLLQKPRAYGEYLNDLDQELINLFRVLQNERQAWELVRLLTLTPFSRAEFDLACQPVNDAVERARRLCIRSFMGFSSRGTTGKTGYRSRSLRSRTGPASDWANYPEALAAIVNRLRGVNIESRPACEIIPHLDTEQTLFYVDPPYPKSTRKKFGAYRHEMTDEDHRELAAVLHGCKGYVVISGYRCKLYDDLFADWRRMERQAMSDHGMRTECLWISPRTWATLEEARAVLGKQARLPLTHEKAPAAVLRGAYGRWNWRAI